MENRSVDMSAVTPNTFPGSQRSNPAQQLNRSCEACRSLKVRCLPDPTAPNQCQRCARAKRPCVFVAPQRRRPRKRTDSRVSQLEKEMKSMRSLLNGRLRTDESFPEDAETGLEDLPPENESNLESKEKISAVSDAASTASRCSSKLPEAAQDVTPASAGYNNDNNNAFDGSCPSVSSTNAAAIPVDYSQQRGGDDVVGRGIISLETADYCISFFNNELAHYFPVVVLPPSTTALQLRQTKPVLFLSVVAAAAMSVDANLAYVLNRELVRLYAERFFIEGEKSLELVQALLLMIVFYFPPDSPLKLQQYQYTHIAGTMALEIGLASKRKRSSPKTLNTKKYGYDEHMAEQARAILGCYHFAATVAMKTRQPNLLFFNDWMSECVLHLARSPHILDRHLATWFELQRITDEVLTSFDLDDTSPVTPLAESRVQAVLRLFDSRMRFWRDNIPPDMLTVPMILEYHYTFLAVYELALGEGYRDPDAIKRRYYTLPPPEEDRRPGQPLSAIRVDITIKWLNSAHEMLGCFLGCDIETLRKMPNLIYTRVGVSLMSLQKIYFSVRTGALGEVISSQSVNVDMYLDSMSRKLSEASGGGRYKIPDRWFFVIGIKARDWYDRFQERQAQKEPTKCSPVANPNVLGLQQQQNQNSSAVHSHLPHFGRGISPIPRMYASDLASVPPSLPPFDNSMGGDYGTTTTITSPWSSDTNAIHPGQTPIYATPIVSSQFPYSPQQGFSSDSGQSEGFFPAGTGMELDDWIPNGSIFGAPALPKY